MSSITVEIVSTISKSKGWGRYSLQGANGYVVRSSTGNHWISSDKTGEAEQGATLQLATQVQEKTGSGRKDTWTQETALVVEEGASCEVEYRPGAQRLVLRVTGARLAEVAS